MNGQLISLVIGWICDLLFGDPVRLPHPIVWFGKMISHAEHIFNKGANRLYKGAVCSLVLIFAVFAFTWLIRKVLTTYCPIWAVILFDAVCIFYCLAGTTLIKEVRNVFRAISISIDEGRKAVGRIVGRDTGSLSEQEVRTAALETLAENLSDGLVAPLFWFALFGTPGMLSYKMINTLDSMIGYRTERYKDFGCVAAHIDDVANYIPARLTAILMVLVAGKPSLISFIWRNGCKHASPNSGYPEAALAGILNCRFGGPHYYFGEIFDKPYIGEYERKLTNDDARHAIFINRGVEIVMVVMVGLWYLYL